MKDATIYTFTTIRIPAPMFAEKAPFVTGIVEDADGKTFNAFIEGGTEENPVAIGKKVVFKAFDENNKPVYTLA
jgi:uncharacterized OB-fold protein